MPIKPENKARYPKDWPAISKGARERAGWKCQHPGCNARQYSVGRWQPDGCGGFAWAAHDDSAQSYSEARQIAAEYSFFLFGDGPADGPPVIVIVLTVAHLDHRPENCDDNNLRAWCQRHHLAYDAEHHRATAQATRLAKSPQLSLIEPASP